MEKGSLNVMRMGCRGNGGFMASQFAMSTPPAAAAESGGQLQLPPPANSHVFICWSGVNDWAWLLATGDCLKINDVNAHTNNWAFLSSNNV